MTTLEVDLHFADEETHFGSFWLSGLLLGLDSKPV